MATKSARMSQHRRQGANPRGFEGSAGASRLERHRVCVFLRRGAGVPPCPCNLAALLAYWGSRGKTKDSFTLALKL